MTLKFLKRMALAIASCALLIAPLAPALAATDHAIVVQVQAGNNPGDISYLTQFMDGATVTEQAGDSFSIGTSTTQAQIVQKIKDGVAAYASMSGYPIAGNILLPWAYSSDIDSKIATALAGLTLPQAMSFAAPTRSLNSAFQVSTTRASFVSYTVDVATSLSLTGGATGTVTLQYADDSGFTTNVKTVQSSVNGNTGTLTIGLALTQTSTAAVTGIIPAGKYVKIVTANTAGTPTFTYRAAQEVLMPSS